MIFRSLYYLRQAMRNQWKSESELKIVQDKLIRNLVRKAYTTSPFYHYLYKKHKVKLDSIKTYGDLTKLPIITKEDIQKYFLTVKQNFDERYIVRKTSGSTGRPLQVYFTPKEWDYIETIYARSLFGCGYRPYEKLLVSYPYGNPKLKWFTNFGLMRKEIIPTNAPVSQLARVLHRNVNASLYGFPSVFRLLLEETRFKIPKIKRIISTGELLNDNLKKDLIEHFNCPVYNHYGSMEFNRISWDCTKQEGLHMDIDALAIEFIKDGEQVNEDEDGDIIISNLHNYIFPLIRYRQGDVGSFVKEKCSCGRGLPLMKNLRGRNNDYIVVDGNKLISPVYLDVILGEIKGIIQYRLIQKSLGVFDIYMVKSSGYDKEGICMSVFKKINKITKVNKMNYHFVKQIEREKGGKLRTIISKCDRMK